MEIGISWLELKKNDKIKKVQFWNNNTLLYKANNYIRALYFWQ